MIKSGALLKLSRQALFSAAAALVLFPQTQSALAGGGHSGDHGDVGRHEFNGHNGGVNTQDIAGRNDGVKNRALGGRNARIEHYEPSRARDRVERQSRSATPKSASKNTIRPIITTNGDRPIMAGPGNGKDRGATNAGSPPSPGAVANAQSRPINTNNSAQPVASAPTVAGKLPPKDPVGNTHPTAGANPPTVVTVSNGVTTTQIQNGPGGVAVYSDKPGTITITNGKESTTLNGGSVTLSGDVVVVGHGAGIEVGPRNGEGKTVVAIKPPAQASAPSAPSHVTGGPEGGFFGALGSSIKDGVKAVGSGIEDGAVAAGKGIADVTGVDPGFTASPAQLAPPPATSTIQQQ